MVEQEYIKKFTDIIDYYKLDKEHLYDIATAICITDQLKGSDPQKLSVKSLACSGVPFFSDISKVKEQVKPLPDVQVLRVLCDTLIIGCKINKCDIPSDSIRFSCVASPLILNGRTASASTFNSGYLSSDACKKIIDSFAKCLSKSNSSDVEGLNSLLATLSNLPKLDLGKVWIDLKYKDSCKYPVQFKDLRGEDYRVSLGYYAVNYMCDPKNIIMCSIVTHNRLSKLNLSKKMSFVTNTEVSHLLTRNSSVYKALTVAYAFTKAQLALNDESVKILYNILFA